jgi:glycosyltransferase involved in cell wall biosynthesis
MTPFFSIVIPLYNKEPFIEKTIQSVLNQTIQDFEIIIINDGSTDASQAKVDDIKDDRIVIYATKNKGVSHARNYGIHKAKGKYIAFLDADDHWSQAYLESMKSLIQKYLNESVFASALKIKTNKSTYNASYKDIKRNSQDFVVDYFEASQNHSILHCSSSVFNKNALEEIGAFDETLKTNEDTDFWIRTGFKFKVVFLNEPLVIHQVVDNSLSKTNRTDFKAIDFNKYESLANGKPFAQQFLTHNKFASAIRFKILGNKESFKTLINQINQNQLSAKQKTLLVLPKSVLLFIVNLNNLISSKKSYF